MLPSMTQRAAEALKPFVDAAIAYERLGTLDREPGASAYFESAQWRELLVALRESQFVAEGVE